MTAVLFVCTGNICRSPTAEGVFVKLVKDAGLEKNFVIDSVGLIDYHVGEPPDPRTRKTAQKHGVDLSDLRARQIQNQDFERFDLLLAMDRGHERQLRAMAADHAKDKIRLFLSFLPDQAINDVPDPYYGDAHDFEKTFLLVERGCRALLEHLTRT